MALYTYEASKQDYLSLFVKTLLSVALISPFALVNGDALYQNNIYCGSKMSLTDDHVSHR